mgnify:CR=1 FL=1
MVEARALIISHLSKLYLVLSIIISQDLGDVSPPSFVIFFLIFFVTSCAKFFIVTINDPFVRVIWSGLSFAIPFKFSIIYFLIFF